MIRLFLIILTLNFSQLYAQDKIIHQVEKVHYFSSVDSKDTFQIILYGNEITEGKVTFRIITNSGNTIFEETYPSIYLIGYGLIGEEETLKRKEEYIIKRMEEFFGEDHFESPTVGINDSCYSDYSDCEIWNILKKDQSSIGFYFLIGEEAGCRIAYSKELMKVVRYYCCC